MIPLSESVGVGSSHDPNAIVNTSNGSPSNLSFAKVNCYYFLYKFNY